MLLPTVGDRVPDIQILDDGGKPYQLAGLWAERPVALFFVRHLGCPFCREQIMNVRDDHGRFQSAGGGVAAVTMGSPKQVQSFRDRLELPFPCLADPQQKAYQALGVPTGSVAQFMGPSIWLDGIRALARGGVGIPRGDIAQLHGAFVIDPQGTIRFVHRPVNSADYPEHDEMITTIRDTVESLPPMPTRCERA